MDSRNKCTKSQFNNCGGKHGRVLCNRYSSPTKTTIASSVVSSVSDCRQADLVKLKGKLTVFQVAKLTAQKHIVLTADLTVREPRRKICPTNFCNNAYAGDLSSGVLDNVAKAGRVHNYFEDPRSNFGFVVKLNWVRR